MPIHVRGTLLAAVLAVTASVAPAGAQVPNVTIGSNPPGSVFYALGSGLAKAAGESGKVKMTVQPYPGAVWLSVRPRER
jgi:TRAP-type uncharacterized transport system substrate-binding protein